MFGAALLSSGSAAFVSKKVTLRRSPNASRTVPAMCNPCPSVGYVRFPVPLRYQLGSKIEHHLGIDFGAGKLNGIDFQGVPADKTQEAGYDFWRLDGAWAALEQTQTNGQNTDAENENGEMVLKNEYSLCSCQT